MLHKRWVLTRAPVARWTRPLVSLREHRVPRLREVFGNRREDQRRRSIAEVAEANGWAYGHEIPVSLVERLQRLEPLVLNAAGQIVDLIALDFGSERYWAIEQEWREGAELRWTTTFLVNAPMKASPVRFRLVGGRVRWHTRRALYRVVEGLPKGCPAVRGLIDGDWIVASCDGRLRPEWLMPSFETFCALVERLQNEDLFLPLTPAGWNKSGHKSLEIAT